LNPVSIHEMLLANQEGTVLQSKSQFRNDLGGLLKAVAAKASEGLTNEAGAVVRLRS